MKRQKKAARNKINLPLEKMNLLFWSVFFDHKENWIKYIVKPDLHVWLEKSELQTETWAARIASHNPFSSCIIVSDHLPIFHFYSCSLSYTEMIHTLSSCFHKYRVSFPVFFTHSLLFVEWFCITFCWVIAWWYAMFMEEVCGWSI